MTFLAAADDAVFWIQPDQQRLEKCASEGCSAPTNLTTDPSFTSLAVDPDYVYFTTMSQGTVERCTHDGCGARTDKLATGLVAPHSLVTTPNAIYWATDRNADIPPAIWRVAR